MRYSAPSSVTTTISSTEIILSALPEFRELSIPLYLGRSTYAVLDAEVEFKRHFVGEDTG